MCNGNPACCNMTIMYLIVRYGLKIKIINLPFLFSIILMLIFKQTKKYPRKKTKIVDCMNNNYLQIKDLTYNFSGSISTR